MNRLIYNALTAVLKLNDRLYGRGASREVLRDLAGDWKPGSAWRDLSTEARNNA